MLRPPIESDLEEWALMNADESVRAVSGLEDQREGWAQLLAIAGHWSLFGWGSLCAVEKTSGQMVGRFGPSRPFGWPRIEVGWMLLPEFHGRGYALEGAVAAMDFALIELGEEQVIHTIRPTNLSSQKLAQKLGSQNLGPITLPPPYENNLNEEWRQTRAQWEQNRKRFQSA